MKTAHAHAESRPGLAPAWFIRITRNLVPLLLVLVSVAGLAGCVSSSPPQGTTDTADYGQPLTIDYKKVIQDRFAASVRNADTLQFAYGPPSQYRYHAPLIAGGKVILGYGVQVHVDGRNSLGGDTGSLFYIFIFRDNALVKILAPQDIAVMDGY